MNTLYIQGDRAMGVNVNTQPTEKYYIDGKGFDICSRDSFGFSIIREDGTVEYIRNTDCDWFARLIKQNYARIEELKRDIETYNHKRELALIAERKNALAVGQMRREWGVTLADANEAQKEKFTEERNSYYTNSMEATKWSNAAISACGSIRDLQSQNSKRWT